MIALKIPQKILDVACHDTQFNVQENALIVLKSLCKYAKAKKVYFFPFLSFFIDNLK
jgi:hypothetical protein